jgi:hypothetical protein
MPYNRHPYILFYNDNANIPQVADTLLITRLHPGGTKRKSDGSFHNRPFRIKEGVLYKHNEDKEEHCFSSDRAAYEYLKKTKATFSIDLCILTWDPNALLSASDPLALNAEHFKQVLATVSHQLTADEALEKPFSKIVRHVFTTQQRLDPAVISKILDLLTETGSNFFHNVTQDNTVYYYRRKKSGDICAETLSLDALLSYFSDQTHDDDALFGEIQALDTDQEGDEETSQAQQVMPPSWSAQAATAVGNSWASWFHVASQHPVKEEPEPEPEQKPAPSSNKKPK